ncbi:MAG: translocation/assembly module TamB domain-containing protein, partial [Bacteroidota bacterium]
INITATTQAGTVFNIPLNTSATVSDYDFIKFVSHKDTVGLKIEEKQKSFNGVTLNFDLTVDEKAIVKITTDYGVLEGSGQSKNLKLRINSFGDFDMFGEFMITSGNFDFTAKNFINKKFTINQGGTIRWTGNPANAEINLKATYEVRTDIKPLYTAAGLQSPKGSELVLVQAELLLTKSLIQPQIDFDFNFPTDPSVKDDVGTYLADANNRNQQALSVIVRRNFNSGTGSNFANQAFATASSAVSEFAFNKINNLIAQSNIKYFDFNIRSFNDASASLKFFNDRLTFSGSLYNNSTGSNDLFNNQNLFNSNFANLTKDFETSYLIRPDGSLKARYSYRVLNTTTLNTIGQLAPQYVNGLGLVYQRDFDTFGEFFRRLFTRSRNPNRALPVSPLPTPTTTPLSGGTPTTEPVKPVQPAKRDDYED